MKIAKFSLWTACATVVLLAVPAQAEASAEANAEANAAAEAESESADAASADSESAEANAAADENKQVSKKNTRKKARKKAFRAKGDKSPIERRPVYFSAGLGAGVSSLAGASLWGTPLAGSFNLRLGAAIQDRWLVGAQASFMAQFNRWAENEPTAALLSSVLAEFTAFPLAHLPFNVSAGVGWGSAGTLDRRADVQGTPIPVSRSGNGVGWMAGAGWDFFPGRGTNLGLQLRYEATQSQNLGVDHGAMLVLWTTVH